jgi:hypothetical protein
MSYDTKIYRLNQMKSDYFKNGKAKPPVNRKKQSNFFITINTNQRVSKNSAEDMRLVDRFQQVCEVFCNNIGKFIKTHDGFPTDDRRQVEIIPQIEISGDRKLLHIHLTCEIVHESKIHMDLPKMREFFRKNTGTGKDLKIFVKWYPGSKITNEQRIKDYVLKGTGGYNPGDMEVIEIQSGEVEVQNVEV